MQVPEAVEKSVRYFTYVLKRYQTTKENFFSYFLNMFL
jgi:hypothetical protein